MSNEEEKKVPQKRGRKKKEVTEEEKEPKVKKKRGRKAALKFFSSSIRKKIPISSNTKNENVILHLDVEEEQNIDELTDDEEVKAVNENVQFTPFVKEIDEIKNERTKNGSITILGDICEKDEWIEKTNIHCWWCCHQFENIPLGMPLRYLNDKGKFKVKGCFCSLACMVSWYNNSKYRTNSRIFTLIKNLHKKLTGATFIQKLQEAPPRETLIMFGGELTIDEFRNSSNNGTIYKMINYPMIVTKEFIEETELNNLKVNNSTSVTGSGSNIGNGTELKTKIKEAKIRLSQIEKPSTENTIDKFLKLKI